MAFRAGARRTQDKVTILIDGQTKEVNVKNDDGEYNDFCGTVDEVAAEVAGWKNYRVFIDGEEIDDPTDAPDNFEGINEVKLTKYDEAGI